MQAFSILHASEHAPENHAHNGKVCDICLSSDQILDSKRVELDTPGSFNFKYTAKETKNFHSKEVRLFNPRAPPVNS
jgi:hypothetical protein